MGGPNNLNEVELFLKNMFSDSNILTMKSSLLRAFVGGMITFLRTESSQEIYRKLGGKSPIVDLTKEIVAQLQEIVGDGVLVDFVMRYTPPFAPQIIEKLKAQNITKIFLIPMYPHYSTTTTKSSLDDFYEALHASRLDATVVEIKHYFENQNYNRAVVERIKEAMESASYEDFDLIFSAHGLPQKIINAGDPYQSHIEKNVALLKNMLQLHGMNFHAVHIAYQSKVGPMKWLEPSLGEKLKTIRNRGVVIYPIAFTVDNSETDYELSIEYKEVAEELGFKNYKVCRCVNSHPLFMDALAEIYEKMKV